MTKKHLNNLITDYDILIRDLIPEYDKMQETVVDALPFEKDKKFTVLDLGSGTGETARMVLLKFPNCRMIGVDIMPQMTKEAQKRLIKFKNRVELITGDMDKIDLPKAEAVVSILAIHHLTHQGKEKFYKKLGGIIKKEGTVVVGDVVSFRDAKKARTTEEKWKEFLLKNLGKEQGKFRFDDYRRADIPSPLEDQLLWLKNAGFRDCKVLWQLMNYAVFCGSK